MALQFYPHSDRPLPVEWLTTEPSKPQKRVRFSFLDVLYG